MTENLFATIDVVEKTLMSAINDIKHHEYMDNESLREAVEEVEASLSCISEDIETIREEIQSLIEWGNNWKKMHEQLTKKEEVA